MNSVRQIFMSIAAIILFPIYYLFELMYRLLLFTFHVPPSIRQIIVYSPCPWVFDHENGFNYTRKGYSAYTINFDNKRIDYQKTKFYTNRLGNMGFQNPRTNKKSVIILGDSFSVGIGDYPNQATWPDLLANLKDMEKYSVANYSRDGTGILNMIDTAYKLCKAGTLESFIFAPYIGDFTRPKIWRLFVPNKRGILDRCFVSKNYQKKTIRQEKIDVAYVCSKKSKMIPGNFRKIFEEANNINSTYFPRKKALINNKALLLNRLKGGSNQQNLIDSRSNNLVSNLNDKISFKNNLEVSKKCDYINSSVQKKYLILLPDYQNLMSLYLEGVSNLDISSKKLLNEFKEIIDFKYYNLADFFSSKEGHPAKYFRAEVNDYHYSNLGLTWVASKVAKIICET